MSVIMSPRELVVSEFNVGEAFDEFEDVLFGITYGKAQANSWSTTIRNISSKEEFEIVEALMVKVYEGGRYVSTEINIHDYATAGNGIRNILAAFGYPNMAEFKMVSQDIPAGTACTVTISPLERKEDGTIGVIEESTAAIFRFDPVDLYSDDDYTHVVDGSHVYCVDTGQWISSNK